MAKILPIPPAFPVPVLPQAFDTSLSYYELLCNLMNAINTAIQQINENTGNIETLQTSISGLSDTLAAMQEQIDGLPAQVQAVSDALSQEIADRTDGDDSLARQISAVSNMLQTFYVSYADMDANYLLGDISFHLLTQAEFDALESAGQLVAKRVYFIDTGDNIVIRYHYGTGNTPTMNAQASGLYNFSYGGAAQNIRGTFTADE